MRDQGKHANNADKEAKEGMMSGYKFWPSFFTHRRQFLILADLNDMRLKNIQSRILKSISKRNKADRKKTEIWGSNYESQGIYQGQWGHSEKVAHILLFVQVPGPWVGELRPSGIRNMTWSVEGRIGQ